MRSYPIPSHHSLPKSFVGLWPLFSHPSWLYLFLLLSLHSTWSWSISPAFPEIQVNSLPHQDLWSENVVILNIIIVSSNLNLFLKTLLQCHLFKDTTHLKCQLITTLIFFIHFSYSDPHTIWSLSNVWYSLLLILVILQPGFPLPPSISFIKGEISVFLTVSQHSLCCLHIVGTQ